MRSFIRIYNKIKKHGIKKSISIFINKFLRVFYVYEIELCNVKLDTRNKYPYKFKEINEEILRYLFVKKKVSEEKIGILRDRINNYKDTLNYAVLNENKDVMGYFSIALKKNLKNPYISKMLRIEKNTSYFFDDFTIEEYRNKGIHTYSLFERMIISQKMGFNKSIILVYSFNKASQKSIEKSGMIKSKKIYEIEIFNKKILIYGRRNINENM